MFKLKGFKEDNKKTFDVEEKNRKSMNKFVTPFFLFQTMNNWMQFDGPLLSYHFANYLSTGTLAN